MLTLTKDDIDYFYLDSSKFEQPELNEMLPYVGNSIVRSLLLANNNNIIEFKAFEPYLNNLNTNPKQGIHTFTKELDNLNTDPVFSAEELANITTTLKKTWDASNKKIKNFLEAPYDEQRITYYTKVDIAEKEKFELTSNSVDKISTLATYNICSLMQKISESLTYRIESYICAPTVVHVVRILQLSKDDSKKYGTNTPVEYCRHLKQNTATEPLCTIGKQGFIISLLEQLGNICRFKKMYCHEEYIEKYAEKCKDKLDKYAKRYKGAIEWIKKYPKTIGGGNPRKSRKNIKKSRKTRRKNSRKYTRYID